MPRLQTTLPTFRMPDPDTIAWMDAQAREADRADAERERRERIERSGIPPMYADADLGSCPEGVREWVQATLGGDTRSLILKGQPGTGKTYAACAALRAILDERRGIYADAPGMLESIKDVFDRPGESVSSAAGVYTAAPVLVIDDLGSTRPTEWSMETIFRIIKRRHEMKRPTIFTTMYDGATLAGRLVVPGDEMKAAAILSRFREAAKVALYGPDRRSAA